MNLYSKRLVLLILSESPVDTRIINEVRTELQLYKGVYKAVKRVADASKISGIIDTQKTVGG